MASTPTTSLLVQKQGASDNPGSWGDNLNVGLDVLDTAIAGSTSIDTTGGTTTLADANYTADAAKSMVLDVTGTLVSNATIIVPVRNKIYAVRNGTSGAYTLTIKTSTGTGIDIPQSASAFVVVDATSDDVDFLTPPTVGTSGVTPITQGGTGATTASGARTNLGLVIGTDVQAWDINTDQIAALTPTDSNVIVGNGSAWVAESGATARTSLGLGTGDSPTFTAVTIGASTPFSDSAGVLTLQNVDALDATTEATIESAIDTLGNLGSIQGVAFTFGAYAPTLLNNANEATFKSTVNLEIGTDVQAQDATLQSLSALGTTADRIAYTTALDTWAETPLTSYGRSLVDDADASAARTTLGVVIGTDVQAYDAELAALAGLTSAADALPYFTGSGTAAVTTLTSYARSLLDDADEATFKATANLETGVDVQAWSTHLDAVAGLSKTDGNFVVTNGTTYVAESGATARTSLGLGTGDSPTFTAITIGASAPFSDAAGTLTLQNVDVIDATTEATIEAAIDTLANLTSIQGRTVTLADAGANAIFGWDDVAGAYENLSAAEATATLNAFVGDAGAGGTKGLVPAPATGDASKFLRGDGTFVTIAGGGDLLATNNLSDLANAATARTNLGLAIGTNVQAYDAELAALAGLASAADALPYFTGAGTAAVTTLTTFGRSLIDDADASTARTTLGLAIGTNVQAYDADLTTWASITPGTGVGTALAVNVGSAGAFVTFNGAGGTPSSITLTNGTGLPASALVASTSQAVGFGSIELGHASDTTLARSAAGRLSVEGKNALLLGQTDTLTSGYAATPFSAGTKSSGTYTPAESDGNFQYATNGGAHTLAPPTNSGTLVVLYGNNVSAGTITTSGFTKVTGDAFTTTSGHEFICYITKHNNGTGFSHLHVTALQ